MFEGFFGSFVAKAIYSVAGAFGLFGGLAVTGVLPVLGDNASDSVIVDTIAVVTTADEEVVLNPVVQLPSVGGVASQVGAAEQAAGSLPNVDGVISNRSGAESGLAGAGLLGILLNSLTGTVDAVVELLPVANAVVPAVPIGTEIGIPANTTSPVLDPATLYEVPSTVRSAVAPLGNVTGTVTGLPLAGELLRTAQSAVFSLVPGVLVVVE